MGSNGEEIEENVGKKRAEEEEGIHDWEKAKFPDLEGPSVTGHTSIRQAPPYAA